MVDEHILRYELVLVFEDADLDAQFQRDAGLSVTDPLGVRLKNREQLFVVRDRLRHMLPLRIWQSDIKYMGSTTGSFWPL